MRATALLSGSSLVVVIAGLVGSKFRAELVGPEGVALAALLTTAVAFLLIPASLGIGPGVVRELASAGGPDARNRAAAIRRAAWRIRVAVISCVTVVLVLAWAPLNRLFLGGSQNFGVVVIVAAALALTMITDLQINVLNGYHKVSVLARITAITAVLSSLVAIAIIVVFGLSGVPAAVLAAAAIGAAVSSIYARRETPKLPATPTAGARREAGLLLRFGLPYTLSTIAGAGSVTVVPVLILHELGAQAVAFYQAAFAVAVGYLGFLLTAMSVDYFPRVSASRHQPSELRTLIQEQLTLVLVIIVPLIIATCAVAPYLISVAYTSAFRPATSTLEWQLFSDLFKFASWTMAFVILARRGSALYLVIESVAGVGLLAATFVGARVLGLAGIGVGFLATYVVYAVLVWVIVRRDIGFRLSRRNACHLAGGVTAVAALQILAAAPRLDILRLALGGALTILATLYSLHVIETEVGLPWMQIIRERSWGRRRSQRTVPDSERDRK